MYNNMYNEGMKQYSIAEARKNFPALVDEAIAGACVQVTRRGHPVAVLVSFAEFTRLQAGRNTFREEYAAYEAEFPDDGQGVEPEYWESIRDRSLAREVDF